MHQYLDRQGVPFFISFDHDSCAGHLIGGCDIEEQRFPLDGRYQNGRISEQSFELVKGFLGLGCLGKVLGLSKQPIQR